jgi:hypothetical protein
MPTLGLEEVVEVPPSNRDFAGSGGGAGALIAGVLGADAVVVGRVAGIGAGALGAATLPAGPQTGPRG